MRTEPDPWIIDHGYRPRPLRSKDGTEIKAEDLKPPKGWCSAVRRPSKPSDTKS